jgi:hypothetical protein
MSALLAALTPAAAAVASWAMKISASTCWVIRSLTWLTCWFELLSADSTTSLTPASAAALFMPSTAAM